MTQEKNPLDDPGDVRLSVPDAAAGLSTPEQVADLLRDTMGTSTNPLDNLTVYRAGKEDYFRRNEDKVASVLGVLLYSQRPMRTWWPTAELTDSPPDCWSLDGFNPFPDSKVVQANSCAKCPHDKFGTAHQGGGKACKTRASDFLLELKLDVDMLPKPIKGRLPTVLVEETDIIGPAMVRYGIGNRDSGQFWQAMIRCAKEHNTFVQSMLVSYGFHRTKSKTGVPYDVVKVEPLGLLEENFLRKHVLNLVVALKNGLAINTLIALAGTARDAGAEG